MLFIWRVAQSHNNQDEEDKEGPDNLNQQLELCNTNMWNRTERERIKRIQRSAFSCKRGYCPSSPLFKDEFLSLANRAFRKAEDQHTYLTDKMPEAALSSCSTMLSLDAFYSQHLLLKHHQSRINNPFPDIESIYAERSLSCPVKLLHIQYWSILTM